MGLDSIEIVMSAEMHFGVSISDAEVGRCRTVRELADALICHLPPPHPNGQDGVTKRNAHREQILDELRRIIAEQMGIPIETIRAESRFVQDLEIN